MSLRARGRYPAVLLLLLLGAAPAAGAQQRISERRPSAADPSIRISNLAGSVRVTGWDKDTIAVSGHLGDRTGRFYLGGTLQAIKLGIELPETITEPEASDLDVYVPRQSRIWVKTASAEIEVTEVAGGLNLFSVGGRIRVTGDPRDVSVESIDGNVEVVGHSPSVRVKTAGGTVVLRGVFAESDVSSVAGPLLIGMEGAIGRAHLESLSGAIAFKGDLEADGALDVESHSGDVELRLPAALGAEYDISAYGGRIRNELGQGGLPEPQGKPGELHFTIGSGSAHVTVRTFKGTVTIKKK